MATQLIALSQIKTPKKYIRKRVKGDYVLNMTQVARDAMKGTGTTLDVGKWPFPAIKVRLVRQEIKSKRPIKEGEKPPAPKVVTFFELVNGINRFRTAQGLKLEKIPAEVKALDDRHAAMAQMTDNLKNGLFLDRNLRNDWIRMLTKEFKFSTREIAKESGLSHVSVARIITQRQGTGATTKTRKHAARKAWKTRRGGAVREPWSPKQFVKQLESVVKDFEEHQAEITEALEKSERDIKMLSIFQSWIAKLDTVR